MKWLKQSAYHYAKNSRKWWHKDYDYGFHGIYKEEFGERTFKLVGKNQEGKVLEIELDSFQTARKLGWVLGDL